MSNSKLMRTLFHEHNFNLEGKKIRAVLEKEVANEAAQYRLWRKDGKPDRKCPRCETDQYLLHVEMNGWLIPTGMTSFDLINRIGFPLAVEKLYGDMQERCKVFRQAEAENGCEGRVQQLLDTEQQEILRLGSDPAAQAEFLKTLLGRHAECYLKAKEDGGQTAPDFIGAAVLDELDQCQQLKAAYEERALAQAVEEKGRRAAEEQRACDAQNEAARRDLESAEWAIRNGGTVQNVPVSFWSDRWHKKTSPILLWLLQKYQIPVHLRTQGWIIRNLQSVTVERDGELSISFLRSKGGKCSDKIWECLRALVQTVRSDASSVR